MNLSASKLHEEAFQLLGIDNEEQLKAIVELVKSPATSVETLYMSLPNRLIAIAPVLAAPNYLDRLKQELQIPIADEVIEAAHEIYEKEFSQLTDHPSFSEARRNLMQRKRNSGQGLEPIANVGGITFTPFLMGHKAPYMPVLKVTITNEQNRVLWSEMMNWFDTVFISRALLAQVSDHAQNTQDMIKAGMATMIEPAKIKESLAELRLALETLEKIISPAENHVEPGEAK